MVALSCAIDALRSANQLLEEPAYAWQLASIDGEFTVSSSAINLPGHGLGEIVSPDMIAICGGDRSHEYRNTQLVHWLHLQAQAGKIIGSISDGAFVVAAAGLFDNVASTIHWKCLDAYREKFPDLEVNASILELSSHRFSCAGGTSSLDLMLHFIRTDFGDEIAARVADNYFHDTIRDESRVQHVTSAFRLAGRNPVLADALLLMEENLETPLPISEIARRLTISRRQLDRIFNENIQTTPKNHYKELRLSRASGLLVQTGLSVTEVAMSCGFQSASHLAKYFRPSYGVTPGEYRKANRVI